jgi:hypothetical protein
MSKKGDLPTMPRIWIWKPAFRMEELTNIAVYGWMTVLPAGIEKTNDTLLVCRMGFLECNQTESAR